MDVGANAVQTSNSNNFGQIGPTAFTNIVIMNPQPHSGPYPVDPPECRVWYYNQTWLTVGGTATGSVGVGASSVRYNTHDGGTEANM